jgi:predicted transposase YdaD
MIYDVLDDRFMEHVKKKARLEARLEGREEGRLEGREEGKLYALHESILTILAKRFGAFPKTLKNRLLSIRDSSTLSMLLLEAVVCDGVPAFKKILNAAQRP